MTARIILKNPFTKKIYYKKEWGKDKNQASIDKPNFKYGWVSEIVLFLVLLGWIFVPFVKWWWFVIAFVLTIIFKSKKTYPAKIENLN
jgi:hypothetical protein